MTLQPQKRLIKDVQVAARLGLNVGTLRKWRMTGQGPVFLKIGGAVRYDPCDVDRYIESAVRSATSQK